MKKRFQPLTPATLCARVSSNRQDADLPVAAQLRAFRDHAENNGYSVACDYMDEAESGRIADRPQFRSMTDEGGRNSTPFQVILFRMNCQPLWPAKRQWYPQVRF